MRGRCQTLVIVTIVLGVLAGVAPGAHGQVSVNVPNPDRVYHDLDLLVAHGFVDDAIYGSRPYSRREIARLVAAAERRLTAWDGAFPSPRALTRVRKTLARLRAEYGPATPRTAPEAAWLSELDVEVVYADSPNRASTLNIEADVNPLLQYRQGRRPVDGITTGLETVHWLRATSWLAFYVRPRVQVSEARGNGGNLNDVTLQTGYAKALWGNVEFQVGRDHMFWGQGRRAGLFLSDHARGLDMVRVTNDRPFMMPRPLRFLGPSKITAVAAYLGRDRTFPGSVLVGYRADVRPRRWLEVGAGFYNEFGGDGSPSSPLLERIADHLLVPDLFMTQSDIQTSNKVVGVDLRIHIPAARGLTVYVENVLDDVDFRRISSTLWHNAGYIVGLYARRLDDAGAWSGTVEWHHTGITLYRHAQFQHGLTLDRLVIGDALGTDANGGIVRIGWHAHDRYVFSLEGAIDVRSNDLWQLDAEPNPRYRKVDDRPEETRLRVVVGWTHHFRGASALHARLGYERATTFGFVLDATRNNYLAETKIVLRF